MMHGECISIGCVAEAEVAARMGSYDIHIYSFVYAVHPFVGRFWADFGLILG